MGKLLENPVLVVMLLLLVVLLFGSKRLPDAARGVGRSLRIFKSETEGLMSTSATAEAAPVAVAPTAIAPVPAAPVVAAPVVAAPAAADAPRYLVDPVTGEQVLAQPVPGSGTAPQPPVA
jgi:sec-independent protein translocase protein TatA